MNDILSKLSLLAERNGTGIGGNPYALNPPLTESQVAMWEAEYRVSLPEAYRYFITNLGDGGYGPNGTMYKLENWWWHLDEAINEPHRWLSGVFAFEHPIAPGRLCIPVEASGNSSLPPFAGTIAVSDEGCGCMSILVVRGTLRGRVCGLDFINEPYLYSAPDFMSWYEAGLNAELSASECR